MSGEATTRRGHALVIGGTGMLRGVSLALAKRYSTVSVVARSHARLGEVARAAASEGGRVHPIPADWHDAPSLALGLRAAMTAHGAVGLAVCWIHGDAPRAFGIVADVIASERTPPRVFRIVGSSTADPARMAIDEALDGVRLRRIVLGFVIGGERSRWLSNEEIGAGVLSAIDDDREETIVGAVTPWSRRPGV